MLQCRPDDQSLDRRAEQGDQGEDEGKRNIGGHPQRESRDGQVDAQGEELRVSEVHHFHDAIDQGEATCHQGVDATLEQAEHQRLDQNFKRHLWRSAGGSGGAQVRDGQMALALWYESGQTTLDCPPFTCAATSVVRGMKPVPSKVTRSYMKLCGPCVKSRLAIASRIAVPCVE